jgi:hypothetical protein
MNKYIAIITCAVACVLCGCSHNAVTFSDGIGFETTMRPDTGNFGVTFRYGKIFSAVVRENTEVEMTGEATTDTNSSTAANVDGSVKLKVGKQITGYYVDAIKAGATQKQLEEYTQQDQDKKAE